MFCLGGFWQGGFLSRGFLSGVYVRGVCPRTPWANPGFLYLLSALVAGLDCLRVSRGSDLSSSILSTKLSFDAVLRHFFSFKLIHQLTRLSNEKVCFKTGGMLQKLESMTKEQLEKYPNLCILRFDFNKTPKFRQYQ